jgi:hypothetical protein
LVELVQELTEGLTFEFASDSLGDEGRQATASRTLASSNGKLVGNTDGKLLSGLSHTGILLE